MPEYWQTSAPERGFCWETRRLLTYVLLALAASDKRTCKAWLFESHKSIEHFSVLSLVSSGRLLTGVQLADSYASTAPYQ